MNKNDVKIMIKKAFSTKSLAKHLGITEKEAEKLLFKLTDTDGSDLALSKILGFNPSNICRWSKGIPKLRQYEITELCEKVKHANRKTAK
jgi:hypothetical protein